MNAEAIEIRSNFITNPKSTTVFCKKIFICLPVNGLTVEEVKDHQNRISEMLKRLYPMHELILFGNKSSDSGMVYIEPKPKEKGSLKYLAEYLDLVAQADLLIFGVGWSGSNLCSTVHRLAEEFGEKEFMYEWELYFTENCEETRS